MDLRQGLERRGSSTRSCAGQVPPFPALYAEVCGPNGGPKGVAAEYAAE
jgi:hypothetical protein